MKQGWEIKSISDVCEVIAGQSPKGKYYNDKGDGLPFYQGKKLFGEKYLEEPNTWTSVTTKESYVGDIVMSVRAPVGDVNFNYHKKICIGRGLAGIRAGETVNKDYLFYFLIHHKNKIVGNTGAVFNSINKSQIEAIPIPIPAFDEQIRIIAKLDECFEAIDKARANVEKNLNNAKEFFQSHLNQIFSQKGDGWVEKKMVDLCSIITCGVASTPKYVDKDIGIPFLSAQNVKNGKVLLDKYKFISKEFHQHLTKKNKPKKGDILYSRVGAKYGEAGVVEHDFEFSVYVSLTLIRPNPDKLNNYYFKYYLNSPSIKSLAKASINSSGVPNLNVKVVREFPVVYPSLSKQKELVNTIDKLKSQTQSLESNYQQELDALDELKKSILQKAFNGEL